MVGPKSPRGLIANGRSCAFESKSWPMISSPEMVMPDCLQVTALFRLLPDVMILFDLASLPPREGGGQVSELQWTMSNPIFRSLQR
jgi:hypothetical protein